MRKRILRMAFKPAVLGFVACLAGVIWAQPSVAHLENDYPTSTRAEYVFACMASNGQTRRVLEQCACSIDVIASIITYEDYVSAETVLSLRLVGGEKGTVFRTGRSMKEVVANMKRAQAEGEIRCF